MRRHHLWRPSSKCSLQLFSFHLLFPQLQVRWPKSVVFPTWSPVSYRRPLLDEVLADCQKLYPDFDEAAVGWFKESMVYNCQGGEFSSSASIAFFLLLLHLLLFCVQSRSIVWLLVHPLRCSAKYQSRPLQWLVKICGFVLDVLQ